MAIPKIAHLRLQFGAIVEGVVWLALAPLCLILRDFSWLPIALIAVLLSVRWWSGAPLLPHSVRAPLVLWLLLLAMAIAIAIEPAAAWSRGWAFLFGVVTLSVVTNLGQVSARAPWIILMIWLAIYIGVAAVGLAITSFQYGKVPALEPIYAVLPSQLVRLQNSFTSQEGLNPNVLAGSLLPAVFVPLSLAIGLDGTRRLNVLVTRGLFVGVTVALIAVIVLAQSRGAYLGLALGCFVLLTLRFPRALWVLPVVAVAVVVAREPISAYFSQLNWEALSSGRYVLWQRAWYLMQDFMFTGTGLNMFAPASRMLYPDLAGDDLTLVHAHNMFMQLVLDFGIFGLVAGLWLMAIVWKSAWRALRGLCRGTTTAWTLRGLLAGQAAWLVFNLTDYANLGSKQGFLFWAAWGLILTLSAHCPTRPTSMSNRGRRENGTALDGAPAESGFNSNARPAS